MTTASANTTPVTPAARRRGGPARWSVGFLTGIALTSSLLAQTFTEMTGVSLPAAGSRAIWVDYDRDGRPDLFISHYRTVGDGGIANSLLRNNGNGTFSPVATGAIVTDTGKWLGASWADFDNDGYDDLVVANRNNDLSRAYRNNGNSSFTQVGSALTQIGIMIDAHWIDYDGDGFLDAFVTRLGQSNLLYRNNRDGSFSAVSSAPFLSTTDDHANASWADYDGDGDLDLFLVSSGIRVYRNDGGGFFTGVTLSGISSVAGVTQFAWGDYDNDGDLDLFVCTYNGGNRLFQNDGQGGFTAATGSTVAETGPSNHANWVDIDNDGDLDLFVLNDRAISFLYRNDGGGVLTKLSSSAIISESNRDYRHAGWGDFNADGALDVVLTSERAISGGVTKLFRNDVTTNKWCMVRLVGGPSNKSGIGAKVRLQSTIRGSVVWQMRQVGGGSGSGGNDGLIAHFGLGDATNIDLVRIEWPSGSIQELANIAANTNLVVSELGYPRIVTQPLSQAVYAGTNVTFTVAGAGPGPFTYQWRFNANNLVGQTSSSLVLNNVQPPTAGTYSVVLSNPYGAVTSSNAALVVNDNDTDGDGMPDFWEIQYALNPFDPSDAYLDKDGDGVLNLLEYRFGTRPDLADTDVDGLTDAQELFVFGTDPKKRDTDGDGVDDNVEIDRGTDPRVAGTKFYYDKNNRLTGADYENGFSIGYTYDGNGNLVRQSHFVRSMNTNGLPVAWRFLNGLSATNPGGTNDLFADADGDGWSNYQEWKAGSSPTSAASKPDVYGLPGTNLLSQAWPFAVSNFVVATGQLDGSGGDEIVVSADGNPGSTTNYLLVLTQTQTAWATQRVDIGVYGVTSLAVGQPTNQAAPAIYLGVRSQTSTGGVMEVRNVAGVWQTNVIAWSTNGVATVLGITTGGDLLATLATTNAGSGSLHRLTFSNGWQVVLVESNPSHRALGTIYDGQRGARLLDSGGIQISRSGVPLPPGFINRPGTDSYYFCQSNMLSWSAAQVAAQSYGGNLVTIDDAVEESWLTNRFGVDQNGIFFSIGLFCPPSLTNQAPNYRWVSGSPATYRGVAWGTLQPNGGGFGGVVVLENGGGAPIWNDDGLGDISVRRAVYEINSATATVSLFQEPMAGRLTNWIGPAFASGLTRGVPSASASLFYAFIDDKNANSVVDAGDDFVVAEFSLSGTNVTQVDVRRVALSSGLLSGSYGLATVKFLGGTNQLLFTAEPDGSVYSWSATNVTGPLQRQLFSAHHAGKAWHALAPVKSYEPGEGLAGVSVNPANPNRVEVIFWPAQPELWKSADVPNTAPAAVLLSAPNTGGDVARLKFKTWDGEGNASTVELQYSFSGQSNWTTASIFSVDGQNPATYVSAPPTGADHELLWNVATTGGLQAGVVTNLFVRVRPKELAQLTGEWSPAMSYTLTGASAPRANPLTFTALEDVSTNYPSSLFGSGVILTSVSALSAQGGTVTTNATGALYTPPTNFFGTDSFTYTIQNLAGVPASAVVTINVAAVNDAPTLNAIGNLTLNEDAGTQTVLLGGISTGAPNETQTLSVTASSSNPGVIPHPTVSYSSPGASGSLSFTPVPNASGSATITVTVTDSGDSSNGGTNQFSRTFTVTVNAVNDPPQITLPPPVVIAQNTSVRFSDTNVISVVDDAGVNPVQLQLIVTNGSLTFGVTNGLTFVNGTNGATNLTVQGTLAVLNSALTNLTWQPGSNFFGADAVRVAVNDLGNTGSGGALTANASLSLFVAQQPIVGPAITTQPQGLTAGAGSSVAFAVAVSGSAPFSYQWQFSGTNLPGQTGPTLSLVAVNTNHTGSYRVVVTNVAGAVTSAPAVLTVTRLASGLVWTVPNPIVYGTALGSGQLNATNLAAGTLAYSTNSGAILPAGNHPLQVTFTATDPSTHSNETRTVSLTVAQAPLTIRADDKSREYGLVNPTFTVGYTGFVNGENSVALTTLPSATSTANVSSPPGTYPITVSGAAAANYTISYLPGTLTVFANTPVITQPPTNFTAIASSNATFAVTATGTAPLTYQWRFSGTNLPGATNATLTLTNVQPTSAGAYNVQVSNPGGTAVSDPANLTVLVPPVITSQPLGQTVGAGSSVAFWVVATGTAPFSYQWQFGGTNLPGATTSVLTITNVLTQNAGNYRVQVSNAVVAVLSDVATLTVLIPVTNSPPTLLAVADRVVAEGSTLAITNQATDTDVPAQTLTFSLAGAPVGAVINSTSGVFSWTPTEQQGPSTNTITVLVTDSGTPPMMAVTSFQVVVQEINTAPTLALGNTNVVEGSTLVLAGYASDVDWPPNTLNYSLLSANPGGLLLNATNGVITWTPTEAQGPGSYNVTVRVVDNGTPSLSATQTFTVNVTELNSPPVLGFIPNQTVYQGESVVIPVAAVDSDLPPNVLTFTLLSAPTNAFFTNNTFVWRPVAGQADTTHSVGIAVTDNGVPSLSATQMFQITVNRLAQLSAQSLSGNRVSIGVSGRQNVIYTLEASTNFFQWEAVLVTNSASAVFEVIESTSPGIQRYYRIREQRQY